MIVKKIKTILYSIMTICFTFCFTIAQGTLTPVYASENSSKVIFVGDSRTVQMRNYLRTNDTYVCLGSMGYNWFVSTALPEVNAVKKPGDIIVMNFGVNDLYQINNYIAEMNYLIENDWSDCTVYYMSVNPVNDAKTATYGGVTNAGVESFNQALINGLSDKIRWIDTYSASLGAINTDASKSDAMGVHYSADIYQLYYDMVQQRIQNDKENEVVQRVMNQVKEKLMTLVENIKTATIELD